MNPVETPLKLSIGQCATLACVMEVTAPKPGNVHRGADFEDLSYPDFIVAATAIGPLLDIAPDCRLGHAVLACVAATRAAIDTNANLGMILLLTPLAMVSRELSIGPGMARVLGDLNAQDARDVYRAIAGARPGGLGNVEIADIRDEPPGDLVAAMALAADRDLVARQYANGFREVLDAVVPWLIAALGEGYAHSDAIVHVHLRMMAEYPDSLIARKCGPETAARSARLAQKALDAGRPGEEAYQLAVGDLDFWLRSDGHRRNPGTTADLIAAGLFVALRDGIIKPPFRLARGEDNAND